MKQFISLPIKVLVLTLAFHMIANALHLIEGGKVQAKRHQTKVQRGTTAEVEVDIYSGRKNPTWVLSEKETEIVFRMLDGLPPASPVNFNGGLGYRGFRVRKVGTLSKFPHEIIVCRGTAYDGVHFYKDVGRQVEHWLLKSSKKHLDAKEHEFLQKETELSSR